MFPSSPKLEKQPCLGLVGVHVLDNFYFFQTNLKFTPAACCQQRASLSQCGLFCEWISLKPPKKHFKMQLILEIKNITQHRQNFSLNSGDM